jgi:hypothetical protein
LCLWNELEIAVTGKATDWGAVATTLEVPPEVIGMEGELGVANLIEGIGVEGACWEEGSCTASSEEVKGRAGEAICGLLPR